MRTLRARLWVVVEVDRECEGVTRSRCCAVGGSRCNLAFGRQEWWSSEAVVVVGVALTGAVGVDTGGTASTAALTTAKSQLSGLGAARGQRGTGKRTTVEEQPRIGDVGSRFCVVHDHVVQAR